MQFKSNDSGNFLCFFVVSRLPYIFSVRYNLYCPWDGAIFCVLIDKYHKGSDLILWCKMNVCHGRLFVYWHFLWSIAWIFHFLQFPLSFDDDEDDDDCSGFDFCFISKKIRVCVTKLYSSHFLDCVVRQSLENQTMIWCLCKKYANKVHNLKKEAFFCDRIDKHLWIQTLV